MPINRKTENLTGRNKRSVYFKIEILEVICEDYPKSEENVPGGDAAEYSGEITVRGAHLWNDNPITLGDTRDEHISFHRSQSRPVKGNSIVEGIVRNYRKRHPSPLILGATFEDNPDKGAPQRPPSKGELNIDLSESGIFDGEEFSTETQNVPDDLKDKLKVKYKILIFNPR